MEQTPWDPEDVAVGLDREGGLSPEAEALLPALEPRALYKRLVAARLLDHRLGRLGLPMWAPAAGEEAVSVAVALLLGEGEWVYPGMRDLAIAPILGMDLDELARQVLGLADNSGERRAPALYNGRAGALSATDLGVAHVPEALGVHLGMAAGQAHASKLEGHEHACVTLFGEGLTTTGLFHETVAAAVSADLPLVMICKSQLWPEGAPAEAGLLGDSVAERVKACGMWIRRADGADAFGVYQALAQAFARAREGRGPAFVEVVVTPLYNPDVPAHRDPVERLRRYLDRAGHWTPAVEEALEKELLGQLDRAFDYARGGDKVGNG
jgi:pyruvate dehydrogenase E1 component alpha subunit